MKTRVRVLMAASLVALLLAAAFGAQKAPVVSFRPRP
jgi:hypothetical protein